MTEKAVGYPNQTQSFFEFRVCLCEQKKCYQIISKTFTGKVLIISYVKKKNKVEYKQIVCKASLKIRQTAAVNYQLDVGFIQTQVKICNSCLLWFSFSLADRKKKPDPISSNPTFNLKPRFTCTFIKSF